MLWCSGPRSLFRSRLEEPALKMLEPGARGAGVSWTKSQRGRGARGARGARRARGAGGASQWVGEAKVCSRTCSLGFGEQQNDGEKHHPRDGRLTRIRLFMIVFRMVMSDFVSSMPEELVLINLEGRP